MMLKHSVLLGLPAGVGLTAAGCGGSSNSSSTPPLSTAAPAPTALSSGGTALDGTVGPGFTITLTKGGQPVTTLAAGTYVLKVDDQARHPQLPPGRLQR